MSDTLIDAAEAPVPLIPVGEDHAPDGFAAGLAKAEGFKGKAGQALKLPRADSGALETVFVGVGAAPRAETFRAIAGKLPAGDYVLQTVPEGVDPTELAIAWGLGTYRFDRYKPAKDGPARLVLPVGANGAEARAVVHACALARDMVNTPANDMGPLQIETIAREIAEQFGAEIAVVTGEDLLIQNYPAVHAVGRAAAPHRAPRMIEIGWGDPSHPVVALVGKGVVFDTGGLDIKPSSGMRLMKKDMGGAAHALALGRMVMALGLPVRLVVLVPVAENAISGDAMRPGDVIASRKGLSIEVGNTDAEGRLILADALARAAELNPALTLDLATLTGAARVALGPQVIPFFTPDDALAADIAQASLEAADPLWRLPLWAGYAEALDSDIADLKNDPDGWAQAGAMTAALFLKRFAPDGAWAHLDIYAWNPKGRPGHPTGAEAQAIRALLRVIRSRFRERPARHPGPRGPGRRGPPGPRARRAVRPDDDLSLRRRLHPHPARARRGGRAAGPAAVRRDLPRDRDRARLRLGPGRARRLCRSCGDERPPARRPRGQPPRQRPARLRLHPPRHQVAPPGPAQPERPGGGGGGGGAVPQGRGLGLDRPVQLKPVGEVETDPAAVAERFLGAPYQWGGRESLGLDCSGLVQQALYACGRACPRDSDQQQALGAAADPLALRRGDLVFWTGHVGMMLDRERLIHANAFHMQVSIEPLAEAVARAGEPTAYRRP